MPHLECGGRRFEPGHPDQRPAGQIGKVARLRSGSDPGSSPGRGTNNAALAQRQSSPLVKGRSRVRIRGSGTIVPVVVYRSAFARCERAGASSSLAAGTKDLIQSLRSIAPRATTCPTETPLTEEEGPVDELSQQYVLPINSRGALLTRSLLLAVQESALSRRQREFESRRLSQIITSSEVELPGWQRRVLHVRDLRGSGARDLLLPPHRSRVAQSAERPAVNGMVAGSMPAPGAMNTTR